MNVIECPLCSAYLPAYKGENKNHRKQVHAKYAALVAVAEAAKTMDAHYSGSLDHQPRYVSLIREALANLAAVQKA